MGEISVNSESVRNGISNIEKALDAIKKSQNNINSAVDNLEKGIGSFDFQSIMSKLSSADARSGEIIRKSDDYISDAKAAEEILSNIYDDIYGNQSLDASSLLDFDGNIELSSEDISLSSSEFNSLLTLLYQTNHAEDAAGLALQMLDSYDGISDSDKEYIMDQMAEGNIRAAVQYILTLMAKQDLEALKDKNNTKIKELETKKGALLLKYYNENPNDDSIPQSTDIKVIDDEIARLKREINAQERVVRQYERANREWEYDKYFNKIGTEEFDIVVEIDFFNAAKDYYNDPDQSRRKNDPIIRDKGTYELAMASILLNDNADDSFINWLKSDECDLENKDKLIDYYNRKIAGNDQSEIEIANKIIDAHRIEQETELPNIYKYEFLSSEEKEVLLYLYLTEGEKAAGQFVEDFKDTINKRWGYNKANEIFTNIITASENGVGVLGANWEGIKIGTEGWFSRMGEIFDSSGVNTGEEYAQMYVNSLLASLSYLTVIDASDVDNYIKDPSSLQKIKERQKNGEKITYADILAETGQITPEQAEGLKLMLKDERVAKFMNDSEASVLGSTHREWLKRFYNAGVSTGAMLPSMVISMATSGILGAGGAATTTASTAGKYAGVLSMFGYEFSVSRSEAIREGRSELETDLFALLSAGSESVSEYLIGGVPFISKGADLFKISPDSSLGWNFVKGLLNMFAIAPGQEILQEEVQDNILAPLSQLVSFGETDYEFSLENFVETAITTYISTVEMQGLSVVSTVNEINLANLNKNTGVAVIEYNGQEIEISAGDLLKCMDEKGQLSTEKMGEIFANKIKNIGTDNNKTKVSCVGEENNERSFIDKNKLIRDYLVDANEDNVSTAHIDAVESYLFSLRGDISSSVLRKINEVIIKNQNAITTNKLFNGKNHQLVDHLLVHTELFGSISTENLIILMEGANTDQKLAIINELKKRFNAGENILSTNSLVAPQLFGGDLNTGSDLLWFLKKYDEEFYLAVTTKSAEIFNKLPVNIQTILNSTPNLPDTSKTAFALMYLNGEIDEAGIDILKSIAYNPQKLDVFNYELLDREIMSDLGADFVGDIGRYSELAAKIVSLKKHNPKTYAALVAMINNASIDNSLQTKTANVKQDIKFLFEHSAILEENIDSVNLDALQDYINLSSRVDDKLIPDFTNNFMEEYYANLDKKAKEIINDYRETMSSEHDESFYRWVTTSSTEGLKKVLLAKLFQMDEKGVNKFIDKYANDIEYLKSANPNSSAIETLEYLMTLKDIDDIEILINLCQDESHPLFTAEEIAALDDQLREQYVDTYVEACNKTNKKIDENAHYEEHDGMMVKIVQMDGDFAFVVHSSDSGFTEDKVLLNDSFVDTFQITSNGRMHGVSTSFITQENMGTAPVGNNGVLYAFNDINSADIQDISNHDLNAHLADYGFSSGRTERYNVADKISERTFRLYNELFVNRETTSPSCVVLLSDASSEVVDNSYRAAAEWGIPVVKIDVDAVASNQANSIQSNVQSYKETGNMDALRSAIISYESGTSGFNLNATEADTKLSHVHDSVSEHYDALEMEKALMGIAQDVKNSNNQAAADEFIAIIDEICSRYKETNFSDAKLSSTKSRIDYDKILEVLSGSE